MLMPSIFGENLFDDFFGDFPFYYDDRAMKDAEKKLYGHKANHVMKWLSDHQCRERPG